MNSSDKARFFSMLANAVSAGNTVAAAMAMLGRSHARSSLTHRLGSAAAAGEELSAAMSREACFTAFDRAIVKAGEKAGALDKHLKILADRYESSSRMIFSILGNFTVPLYYLAALGIALVLHYTLAKKHGLEPFPAFYGALWMIGSFVAFILAFIFIVYPKLRSNVGVQTYGLKSFPWLAGLYVRLNTFLPFIESVRHLYRAGYTVPLAMEIALDTTDVEAVSNDLSVIVWRLKKGESVEKAMPASALLPDEIVQAMIVGDKSGKLDETLGEIQEKYMFRLTEINKQIPKYISIVLGLTIFLIAIAYGISMLETYWSSVFTFL